MSTPEQIAAGLRAAADDLGNDRALMQRIVYLVLRRVQKRTHVLTGHLRRSEYGKVLTAEKGVVGSNVAYLRWQKNKPLTEGASDARSDIDALLRRYGIDVLEQVG